MKKLKRICSLTIAVAFLLNSVPYPAYGMRMLLPEIRSNKPEFRKQIEELAGSDKDKSELYSQLTVGFNEVGVGDVELVGGKGANLGEMAHIKAISVPPGFMVTTTAYKQFVDSAPGLKEYIRKQIERLKEQDVRILADVGGNIRNRIVSAELPSELKDKIIKDYRRLCRDAGVENLAVAVRSSASAEDLPDASFAGQQDTYLNMRGEEQIVDAVKRCFASLFTNRTIEYRTAKGFDHFAVNNAVVVQQMIRSAQSGVGFSVDIETGWNSRHRTTKGVIYINVGPGLGEAIVSGTQTPDKFLMALTPSGKIAILDKELGPKETAIVYDEKKGGTREIKPPSEVRNKFSISDTKAIEIAKQVRAIADYYNDIRDIEVASDKNGKLWITQARAETVYSQKDPSLIEQKRMAVPEKEAEKAEVLFEGSAGLGAVSGRVVIIDAETPAELTEQMNQVKKGDIICANVTGPDMVQVMKIAGGFVTEVGGNTSHAAIIGRELGKPAIVGVGKGLLRTLKSLKGEQDREITLTLDADRGCVYARAIPLEEIGKDIDISKLPLLAETKIGMIVANPAMAARFPISQYGSHYGISLMRAEFALADIGVHPQALFAYDRGEFNSGGEFEQETILKQKIEEKIKGYKSGYDFYVQKLSMAIAAIAACQKPEQIMTYRTSDFKTNEYRELLGGNLFEAEEVNPMMGFRGEGRMIDPGYADVFGWELEAIKRARDQGYKNVAIMFPVVRTPQELTRMLEFLDNKGLTRGKDSLEIGMMVEVPNNVLRMQEFLLDSKGEKRVDFVSIGSNDLTQFTLGVDRDSEKMRTSFDETDPAVLKALEIVIKIAKKCGVKTGLCGQRPSSDPGFAAKLIEFGIGSIGVVDSSYVQVVEVVAEAEKRLKGVPAKPAPEFFVDSTLKPEEFHAVQISSNDILANFGIHPLAMDDELRKKYQGEVYKAMIEGEKHLPEGASLVFRTNDLDSLEFSELKNGKDKEIIENNPSLGFNGLVRLTNPAYEGFFRSELKAIIKGAIDVGYPVKLILTQVRTLEELKKAFAFFEKLGLVPGERGFSVGLEISTLANVLLLDDIFEKYDIDFVEINRQKLAQYQLAVDGKSKRKLVPEEEIEDSLRITEKIIYATVAKNKVNLEVPVEPATTLAAIDDGLPIKTGIGQRFLERGLSDAVKQNETPKVLAIHIDALNDKNDKIAFYLLKSQAENIEFALVSYASKETTEEKLAALGMNEDNFDYYVVKTNSQYETHRIREKYMTKHPDRKPLSENDLLLVGRYEDKHLIDPRGYYILSDFAVPFSAQMVVALEILVKERRYVNELINVFDTIREETELSADDLTFFAFNKGLQLLAPERFIDGELVDFERYEYVSRNKIRDKFNHAKIYERTVDGLFAEVDGGLPESALSGFASYDDKATIDDITRAFGKEWWDGEVVVLRSDLNIGATTRDNIDRKMSKIEEGIPNIETLSNLKAKVVVLTHSSRREKMYKGWDRTPEDGEIDPKYSTEPLAKVISERIGKPVKYVSASKGRLVEEAIRNMQPGDVIILENLRFWEGETAKGEKIALRNKYAEELYASFKKYNAKVVVSGAFQAGHRGGEKKGNASFYGMRFIDMKVTDSFTKKELKKIGSFVRNLKSPYWYIAMGDKLDKIDEVKKLIQKSGINGIIWAGKIAEEAKRNEDLLNLAKEHNVEMVFPLAYKWVEKLPDKTKPEQKVDYEIVPVEKLGEGKYKKGFAVDIEDTSLDYFEEVLKDNNVQSIFANGAAGMLEIKDLATGSMGIGQAVKNLGLPKKNVLFSGGSGKIIADEVGLDAIKCSGGGVVIRWLSKEGLPAISDLNTKAEIKQFAKVSSAQLPTISEQLEEIYEKEGANRDDYYISPIVVVDSKGEPVGKIEKGDIVIWINHRGDRSFAIMEALTNPDFNEHGNRFPVEDLDLTLIPFGRYDDEYFTNMGIQEAFPYSVKIESTLGSVLAENRITQARVAESEKYPHVTYFLDGRRNVIYPGEDTVIIPSEPVADKDKKPEMKFAETAQAVIEFVKGTNGREKKKVIVVNFALDIQGHELKGDKERGIRAVLATDKAVGEVLKAVEEEGGAAVVTADHGNIEETAILDKDGKPLKDKYGVIPSKQHVFDNPVPFIVNGLGKVKLKKGGTLANITPTILEILGLPKPPEMDESLLVDYEYKEISGPVVLIIRDGWGISKWDNPEANEWNAVKLANPSVDKELMKNNPWRLLKAHGDAVGLPEYQMGDSDNGHVTIGAGKAYDTLYKQIIEQIENDEFSQNTVLLDAFKKAKQEKRNIHIIGLTSSGGVHSGDPYLPALLEMAKRNNLDSAEIKINLWPILDGRDVQTRIPDQSGQYYLGQIQNKIEELELNNAQIAGIMGRYYAMDRDAIKRDQKGKYEESSPLWQERFKPAYRLWVYGEGVPVRKEIGGGEVKNLIATESSALGAPTVKVVAELADGSKGSFVVPAGTSAGIHERPTVSVEQAIKNVEKITAAIKGKGLTANQQVEIAQLMLEMDKKETLGANATLPVQMALAWAVAEQQNQGLYKFIREIKPSIAAKGKADVAFQMNITNGGLHADNDLDMQEFMIVPHAETYADAVRMGLEIDKALGEIYKREGLNIIPRGKEGGYSIPNLKGKGCHEKVLEYLIEAIEGAGYKAGRENIPGTVSLALDAAASSMLVENTKDRYHYEGEILVSEELIEIFKKWSEKYPIISIEDGLGEEDWDGWKELTKVLGDKIVLIGDDIFVTQAELLRRGIREGVGNAVLIKPNQNGFLTTGDKDGEYPRTLEVIEIAKEADYKVIISHRSKEADAIEKEVSIADLAVAVGADALKIGDPVQDVRRVKYDRMVEIEQLAESSQVKAADVEPFAGILPEDLRNMIWAEQMGENKGVVIGWRVFFDKDSNLRVPGVEAVIKNLNAAFMAAGRSKKHIVIALPDLPPVDEKMASALWKILNALRPIEEEILLLSESEVKKMIKENKESVATIDVEYKAKRQRRWYDEAIHKTILAEPKQGEVMLPWPSVVCALRELSVEISDDWLNGFERWLIDRYEDKIAAEEIRKMFDIFRTKVAHPEIKIIIPAAKATTEFLEDYQRVLSTEELLRQAG